MANSMDRFPSKEYELIRRIQKILPPVDLAQTCYEEAIGGDAAIRVSKAAGERLVITADVSVENVHFSQSTMTLEEAGCRAMASNLSDCAAMGAFPDSALVQLVFPSDCVDVTSSIENIYAGFARACERWKFPIVGGDLSRGAVWTLGITLIGAIPAGGRALKRTGIVDGDALWVTGTPGGSAAGLAALKRWGRWDAPPRCEKFIDAHVAPTPRIGEGAALAACPDIHAMMDLSDGLSKDVGTLCFDNNLGFIFESGLKPSSETMNLAKELDCDWENWFYHGGEEYELLFACAPSFDPTGVIKPVDNKTAKNLLKLGHFTSKFHEMRIPHKDNTTEVLQPSGWDHIT